MTEVTTIETTDSSTLNTDAVQSTTTKEQDVLDHFTHYVREYSTEFYDYGKISNTYEMLEFTKTLHQVLDEAELIGISQHYALIAPMVGRVLSLVSVEDIASDNVLMLPLTSFVEVDNSAVDGVFSPSKGSIFICGKCYDVTYTDKYSNRVMYDRLGSLSDVIVPVYMTRIGDGNAIDLTNLTAYPALNYYKPSKTGNRLDFNEFIVMYFNQWIMSPLPFSTREDIVTRDRYVADVIVSSFESIEIPADLIADTFKMLSMIGDDVRMSKTYRTALMVSALMTSASKSKHTTIVLK